MDADTCRHLDEQGLTPDRLLEHALDGAFALFLRGEAVAWDRPPRDRPYPVVARPPDTPRALGAARRSGEEYSYGGERIGQGKDNARLFLKERPALAREIENKVRAALGVRELPVVNADGEEAPAPKLKAVD